jgi:hypothetical protein
MNDAVYDAVTGYAPYGNGWSNGYVTTVGTSVAASNQWYIPELSVSSIDPDELDEDERSDDERWLDERVDSMRVAL